MVCLDEGGRGLPAVRVIAAPAHLAPWVEHFWIQTWSDKDRRLWRVVPDPSAHLIYSLVDGAPRCTLVGSRTSYCDIDVGRRRVTIGARLRPGALMHSIHRAADTLTDGSFLVEDLFGSSGKELGPRMAEATPRDALSHLGRFLAARFAGCEADRHLDVALRSARSVEAAAASLGISPRTLRGQTLCATGLSPKRILRIRRLYRALQCATKSRPVWSDIALRTGHSDQAHMVREFRELLGDSPEKWYRRGFPIGPRASSAPLQPRSSVRVIDADSFNTPHN